MEKKGVVSALLGQQKKNSRIYAETNLVTSIDEYRVTLVSTFNSEEEQYGHIDN